MAGFFFSVVILVIAVSLIRSNSKRNQKIERAVEDIARQQRRLMEIVSGDTGREGGAKAQITSGQPAAQVAPAQVVESVPPPLPSWVYQQGEGRGDMTTPKPVRAAPAVSQDSGRGWFEAVVDWVKEDWLVKIGGLMLLLAVGWFVTYAFVNNWVTPAGRVGIVAAFAALVFLTGWRRIDKFPNQGSVFVALGAFLMTVAMYSGCVRYNIFPDWMGVLVSGGFLGWQAHIAVGKRVQGLVYLSAIGGCFVPHLFGFFPRAELMAGYLLLLTAASAHINFRWEQRWLPLISGITVFLYAFPYTQGDWLFQADVAVRVGAFLFVAASIVIFQAAYALKNTSVEQMMLSGAAIALSTLALLAWTTKVGTDVQAGLFTAGYSAVAGLVAWACHRWGRWPAFAALWALSTALALLSFYMLFNPPELTLFLTLLAILTVAIAHQVGGNTCLQTYTCGMFVLPSIVAADSLFTRRWETSVINTDAAVLLLLSVTLLAVAWWMRQLRIGGLKGDQPGGLEVSELRKILAVGAAAMGGFFGCALVWLALTHSFEEAIGVTGALLIYTVAGLFCYRVGIQRSVTAAKVYGQVLLGLVIARVFLIELWRMDTGGRILIFFVIGALLISTAFWGKKISGERKEKD